MAVGTHANGEKPLIEAWNGTEWTIIPSPSRGSGADVLSGVSCVSVGHCVAVGAAEGALVESWNGSTWSIVSAPNPQGSELNGVSCVSAGSCAAAGTQSATTEGPSQTLVETSRGGVWSVPPSANGAGGASALDGVACTSFLWVLHPCVAVGQDEATPEGPLQALVEDGAL